MKSTGSNTPALAGTSVKTCFRATYVAAMVVDLDMFTGPAPVSYTHLTLPTNREV